MKAWLLGITGVTLGVLVGGFLNITIIGLGPTLFPLPEGIDPNDVESLAANMDRMGFENFIAPWLAHATNAFVGGLIAALVAASHRMRFALGMAAFVLLGGIAAAFMIPAPITFLIADIGFAYLPMGWLAGRLALALRPELSPG